MRHIALAIAALVAAPAFAQPPVDWTKPVTGVDAPPVRSVDDLTDAEFRELQDSHALPASRIAHVVDLGVVPVNVITAADLQAIGRDTPLPPPCEPPTPRGPPSRPGPPAPAPCPTPR